MTSSQDEFEDLRRLLAWKSQERPTPGYFHFFSRRVISRLEVEQVMEDAPWWRRWLFSWDAKPVLACAYGVAVCGLLTCAVGFSEMVVDQEPGLDNAKTALTFPVEPSTALTHTASGIEVQPVSGFSEELTSSVHPVGNEAGEGPFFYMPDLKVMAASYELH